MKGSHEGCPYSGPFAFKLNFAHPRKNCPDSGPFAFKLNLATQGRAATRAAGKTQLVDPFATA
jgi:hypothetical protein